MLSGRIHPASLGTEMYLIKILGLLTNEFMMVSVAFLVVR
jgi:hypothetical protein